MANFFSQGEIDPVRDVSLNNPQVIENKRPGSKLEPKRNEGTKFSGHILEDTRKFGRDLKNCNSNPNQTNDDTKAAKSSKNISMKNVPQNILLKKDPEPSKPEKEPRRSGFFLIKEPEKVNYSKYPQPDAILIYGKPSTPKKEDLISNDVTFSAISERMSFANDIEKFIAPATMERKEENVTGEDPQKVTEYANEIYHFLRQNDKQNIPMPGYMRIQTDINQKMRAILIDWLVSVHLKLDLKNETLYLTVNLLDRYLATTWVSKSKLQLVGIVALLIACKYEEIYPPLINDLIALTDNAFNREEFLETELKLMSSLRFKITFASSSLFVDRYADVIGCDPKSYALARYLIELAMIEYKMLKYTPSIVGASAVNLACKLFGKPSWSTKMTNAANYIESQLLNCMKDLLFLLKYSKYSKLTGIRDKYSKEKLMRVSLIDFFSKP